MSEFYEISFYVIIMLTFMAMTYLLGWREGYRCGKEAK